jgi:hypothetical protein
MKKFIVLFAFIALVALLLVGCNKNVVDIDAAESETSATDMPTEKPAVDETPKHWQLKCRITKEYQKLHFEIGEKGRTLSLQLPKNWKLTLADGAYTLEFDGEQIGSFGFESAKSDGWTLVEDYTRAGGNQLSVTKLIESRGSGKDVEYRYIFEYEYKEDGESYKLYLTAPYTELDANAADKLYQMPEISAKSAVVDGSLSHLADGKILILGNSFIGSSQIGYVLSEMLALNDKSLAVSPIGRGYATVATYIADEALMSRIENGEFDGVFICGFYSDDEANNLKVLETACNLSDTTLVIFPAHNEFDSPINLAQKACPDLPVLNWRGELNSLIETGVDRWDLCVNDAHGHSTVYAGLVGAHMIYRSIYSAIPNIDGMFSLDIVAAREIIGSYLETGELEYDYEVLKFN